MSSPSEPLLVIISGVSRGLGHSIALALLQSGYRVARLSRKHSAQAEELEKGHADRFYFATADACDNEAVGQFTDEAVKRLGPPFAVINNSAIAVDGVLATMPEVEIARMVQTDLIAPIVLTRLCVRKMLNRKAGGRVINISSIVGSRGYNGLTTYSACKAGLDGFTRSLARELGPRNITVNSVAPGYMRTDMSASLEPSRMDQIVRRTPLGRLAELADIVPAVQFLLSPGGQFITGQTLIIDGGITC